LKHIAWTATLEGGDVAPRAGAWIETSKGHDAPALYAVAPRAGAWIETTLFSRIRLDDWVAPRAGAWIET